MRAIEDIHHQPALPSAYWTPFSWRVRLPWQRYLFPLLAVFLTCIARSEFLSFLGPRLPFVAFLPAVTFAFLYSGVFNGLLAAAVSACYVIFALGFSPDNVLIIHDSTERLVVFFSLASTVMIVVVAWQMCLAQRRAAQADHQASMAGERSMADEERRKTEALYQEAILELNAGLEKRVTERTAELEAAIREQESFSYSVSHDLRAPLRHINCFSAIVVEEHGAMLPDEAREYLERIRSATRQMGAMIDHLLEFSRLSRTEMDRGSVDLSGLAAEIGRMLHETEPHRQVELCIQDGMQARGDHDLLGQLLKNLLENAWKYSATRPVARIEFGKGCVDGRECFFVRDNGVGFEMQYSGKLFEVFQRLHGAGFEGTGIGLATAHRIVKRHQGSIWAEGEVDKGATFYFTLPVPGLNTPERQPLKA